MVHNYPDIDLVSDNEYKNLVKFHQCILKDIEQNPNSYAKKTKIYNTNVDIVNDNVYTKFGLNLSIRCQDMEQKPDSDVNQGL